MNKPGTVAAVGLAAGAVLFACWRLGGSPSGTVPAEVPTGVPEEVAAAVEPLEAPEAGPPTAVEYWVEEISDEPRVVTPRTRRPEEVPTKEGTVILVVDSRDEEPIERFALRISRGASKLDTDGESTDPAPVKEFPEGALLVEASLEGFCFAIRAPGYLPTTGEITHVSNTDRRAYIRLIREAVVRGRVVFEGKPVPHAAVSLRLGRPRALADGEDLAAWYDEASPVMRSFFERTRTDGEGSFEIRGLPAGQVRLTIWNTRGQDLEEEQFPGLVSIPAPGRQANGTDEELWLQRELGDLEIGQELDLGDLELGRKPEPEVVVDFGASRGSSPTQEWTSSSSGRDTRVVASGEGAPHRGYGSGSRGGRVVARGPDATVRVQAFDGERPIVGVTVVANRIGGRTGEEVGVTDQAGEALFELNPADPAHLVLRIGKQLPLGRTETPVTAVRGRETLVPIVLHCGSLVLEIPEGFKPGADSALLVQFESETLPEPGYVLVTLRGDPADFVDEGILWTGNRVELPSLGAGHYQVSVDVMKRQGERSRTLLPTELRYRGEALVVAGKEVTCALTER